MWKRKQDDPMYLKTDFGLPSKNRPLTPADQAWWNQLMLTVQDNPPEPGRPISDDEESPRSWLPGVIFAIALCAAAALVVKYAGPATPNDDRLRDVESRLQSLEKVVHAMPTRNNK